MKARLVNILKYKALIILLSGIFLGIGFVFSWLSFLCLIGLVLCFSLAVESVSVRCAALYIYMVWFIKSLLVLCWVLSVYPLQWVDIEASFLEMLLVFAYWISGASILAFGGLVFGAVVYLLRSRISFLVLVLLLPFVWLVCEWLTSVFFSLVTLGGGSYLQNYMSFGQLGYLALSTNLGIYLAKYVGFFGLTIGIIAIAGISFFLLRTGKYVILFRLFLIFLLLLFAGHYSFEEKYIPQGISMLSVSTKFSPELLKTKEGNEIKISAVSDSVKAALTLNRDYVLLPEDSRYFVTKFADMTDKSAYAYYQFAYGGSKSVLIDSGRTELKDGRTVLRAAVFDGKADQIYHFDKKYLVPQGEYMPYLYQLVISKLGFSSGVQKFKHSLSYVPGPIEQSTELPENIPAVLFCFESVQKNRVAILQSQRRIPFVAHPVSHAWFHDSKVLQHQLDTMLVLQAVTNSISIISAGNQTQSKWYTPDGNIEYGVKIVENNMWSITEFSI
jgi:apolipoprotein N-acyltransferase